MSCNNPIKTSERSENVYKSNKERNEEIKQQLYDDYKNELREAQKKNIFPLHLYSKRVYRAYHNMWRLIDRKLLTQEEVNIMFQLGIYKPSQKELGIRNLKGEERKEMCKIRLITNFDTS